MIKMSFYSIQIRKLQCSNRKFVWILYFDKTQMFTLLNYIKTIYLNYKKSKK